MAVWYCIPSKRPATEAEANLSLWRRQGYRLALWRDPGDDPVACDLLLTGQYPGYARAVNALCSEVLARFPDTQWLVTGGDDIQPDPNHFADEIAIQCTAHFGGTFGVMQPVGDRWGVGEGGFDSAYIDRICGSPWMGREFCQRIYGGRGPLFDGYAHMFVDQEMQEVATKIGVLWQRRDLTHFHQHWARSEKREIPGFLAYVNSPQHWNESQALFTSRKTAGFPGHQPKAAA